MDPISYRHSQFGHVAVGLLLSALAIVGILVAFTWPVDNRTFLVTVLALLLVCLVTFTRLTTVVTARTFKWYFGFGWPRGEVDIAEVTSVVQVRNPWYYGWGLRLTPVGMLWNVAGNRAIEVHLRNGKRFRIGTDEPQPLADAVTNALPGES